MTELRPFHLAVPVHDLAQARSFYGDLIGCSEGRSSSHWIDFDFFGHQFVCHLDEGDTAGAAIKNAVDGDAVPVPHFGVILQMEDWHSLKDRLKSAGINFVIEPRIRFRGETGEQATMFFTDPSGNALEFNAFGDDSRIFAK
ncbi:MAG: glyoxalase [Xanthomonadales bacterium]|nr:glyoxalase [Xanthomonadales bacterium]